MTWRGGARGPPPRHASSSAASGPRRLASYLDLRPRLLPGAPVCQDLTRTAELCRSRDVLLNLDAIQYVGALHLDLGQCPVDLLSVGGHKWLLGPIGTGFFYCRRAVLDRLRPHNIGYHSVAKDADHLDYDLVFRPDAGRFEEALVNFPGLWGLEAAVDLVLGVGTERIEQHILALTDFLVEGLRAKGYVLLSSQESGERSGIVSFRHPTRGADEIQTRLQVARIDVAICLGALRASPGVYNDVADVQQLLEALP